MRFLVLRRLGLQTSISSLPLRHTSLETVRKNSNYHPMLGVGGGLTWLRVRRLRRLEPQIVTRTHVVRHAILSTAGGDTWR